MSKIIRARAPLRLGFGGGGTDVSPYAEERGGRVLNATINRYAYATLIPNESSEVILRSLDYGDEVSFPADGETPPFDYQMDLAKGVIRRLLPDDSRQGFELFTHTDCPPGSGLGASSTMVVAMIGAFDHWLGLRLTRYEIARLAWEIERRDLRIHGGKQDQYAAAFGGFNYLELEAEGVLVNPLRIPSEWKAELEYSIVLAYTGVSRASSEIIEDQMRNYSAGSGDPIEAMDRSKQLAFEMKEALLRGQIHEMGALMDEAWQVKRRMSEKISNPHIDRLYTAARDAGAVGGKISGAGGGGFMFFFTRFDRRHAVIEALESSGAEVVHFGFRDHGLETWVL